MSTRWFEQSVLVTVGTGGVGKTTTAAAIGLEAAARGRRTLVLTIDPARRLAQALGVDALGAEPQRISHEIVLREACADASQGAREPAELFAMMLDTQHTFDELVARFAPDADTRERILRNPIYRNLTDALAGTREYSAMEKLHQVVESRAYDLVVLDTPPATHALHFLDAPRRLTAFLDGSFLQLLLRPAAALGRTSFRVFRFGSELALKALERITGLGFFSALSEFLLAFEGLLGGFRERADAVGRLLQSETCGFVLVAGPDPEQVRRAVAFWDRLREEKIHLVGLIVNRVQTWPGAGPAPDPSGAAWDTARSWMQERMGAKSAAELIDTAQRHAARARADAEMSERLEKALPLEPERTHRIPLLPQDIHQPGGLAPLCRHLFDSDGSQPTGASREARTWRDLTRTGSPSEPGEA